jgi:DnaJ-class molecular chaperone
VREPTTYINDEDEEVQLPTHWQICDTCRGEGTRVNPAIDGNGLDPHDPDLDEDFWDNYWGGTYDVKCSDCDGLGRVKVVNEEALSPEVLAAYHEHLRDYHETEAIYRQERMMGA